MFRALHVGSRSIAAVLCTLLLAGGVQADEPKVDEVKVDEVKADELKVNRAAALSKRLERLHYIQGDAIDSINDYELDGWNYIDKSHIVIHSGPSHDYLITLMGSCSDLSSAENIAFTTTTRKLTHFDKLMVRGAGGMTQHCPITRINALAKIKH